MKKLKIPYAIADYAECRYKGYYYVDKTRFIEKLESYKAPVFLRPRRFGKSLLCSMLSCYYDLRQSGQFENLFGDTYIGQYPTEEHNQYLVLRFDFSKLVMADSVGELEMRFNQLNCTPINSLVRRDAYYAHLFGGLRFRDEDNASTMLEDTLAFVKDHNSGTSFR